VPGGKSGSYHRILLGLADGRHKRAKGSLRNVMNAIKTHMRQSLEVTEVVVVITNLWDKDIFGESVDDISFYQRIGKKFMFLLVNGRRLVPMEFAFA
jgi:hypothetical protein